MVFSTVKKDLSRNLKSLSDLDVSELIKQRQDKVRGFGRFSETS